MADVPTQPELSQAELSMEEILAVIRRNIAEGGVPPLTLPPLGRGRGILDLTEAIEPDGTVRHIAPGAADAPLAPPLGEPAGDPRLDRDIAIATGGRTLDDIAADLLRPLVRAWLDAHLPGMVERLVRDELALRRTDRAPS